MASPGEKRNPPHSVEEIPASVEVDREPQKPALSPLDAHDGVERCVEEFLKLGHILRQIKGSPTVDQINWFNGRHRWMAEELFKAQAAVLSTMDLLTRTTVDPNNHIGNPTIGGTGDASPCIPAANAIDTIYQFLREVSQSLNGVLGVQNPPGDGPSLTTDNWKRVAKYFKTLDLDGLHKARGMAKQLAVVAENASGGDSVADVMSEPRSMNGPKAPDCFEWYGKKAELTRNQYKLVAFLWNQHSHTATCEAVGDAIWGHDHERSDNALTSHINRANLNFAKVAIPVTIVQKATHVRLEVAAESLPVAN